MTQNNNPITGDNIVKKHPLLQFKGMNFDGSDFEKRTKSPQFAMMSALQRILGGASHSESLHKEANEPLED